MNLSPISRYGATFLALMLFSEFDSIAQSTEASAPKSRANVSSQNADQPRNFFGNQPSPATAMLRARFQATVYELQAAGRADTLDPQVLALQAATPESLLKALTNFAESRIVYHIDQPVNVFSEGIIIGSSEPIITGSRTDIAGNSVNSIAYRNVGLTLRLSARVAPESAERRNPEVSLVAQISTIDHREGGTTADRRAAAGAVTLNQTEPLEFRQPRVVLGARSAPATGQTNQVVYILRYVFDEYVPKGGAAGEAGAAAMRAPVAAGFQTNPNGPEVTLPAQFQATAYEVLAPRDCLAGLDAKALEQEAATAEQLLGALNRIGDATITYRLDQAVNVLSDQASISTNQMIVVGARTASGPGGRHPVFSKMGERVGFRVRLSATTPEGTNHHPNVSLMFQSSGLTESDTELTAGTRAEAIQMRSAAHSEPLEFGPPRVILHAVSPEGQATTKLTVFRYLFRPPPAK